MATKVLPHNIPKFWFSETQKAILCKIFAIILYALNNVLSKKMTTYSMHPLSVEATIFYQYLFACIWLVPYSIMTKPAWNIPTRWDLHLGRIICCFCGLILLHDAFRHMPLAQAVGFNIFSPLITLLGAYVFLGEKINANKMRILCLSIGGYLLLLKPYNTTHTQLNWHILEPSLAILCFQINTFFTKLLTRREKNHFYLNAGIIVCLPVCLLPYMLSTPALPINTEKLVWLFCMGSNDFLAMLALNYAIAKADVSFLLPLGFAKYTLITLLGFVFFQEMLSPLQIIGLSTGLMSIWLLQKKTTLKK